MGILDMFAANKKEIYIEGEQLYYLEYGNMEQVDLSKLKYAYAEVLGGDPYLFLFDHRQCYISGLLNGFDTVYRQLSLRFGFDDTVFYKVTGQTNDIKKRIWLKKYSRNYSILQGDVADYTDGFEVMTSAPHFVSWDTSYDELETLNVGHIEKSDYDIKVFVFDYPVRIGNMVVEGLEAYYDNERTDIAVQHYICALYNEAHTDTSYYEIKAEWMQHIPIDIDACGYERDDQKYLTFDIEDVWLSISYTYDTEEGYDDGSTSLSIQNNRSYPDLLDHPDYTDDHLHMDAYIKLGIASEIVEDYRKNINVFALPSLIRKTLGNKSGIWLDKNNGKIGFAGEEMCLIYDIHDIKRICFYNLLPAKGPGYASFEVQLKDKEHTDTVFYGDCYAFDSYAGQLREVFGLDVYIPEADYNC
ncbi:MULTISPECIES: hypothetical protein [unclassified Sphingobacterium]|uniref:hypothetical protein n=1 Tax=unclassified Sphingobacterium TaxID=2609468 RepID=UPI0025DD347B|nr:MULTISPECIES: hypothetical protein [unclassified Sphingobacterium]